jgi:hypothetical protein
VPVEEFACVAFNGLNAVLMSDRSSITVGLLAMAATIVVIPASVALVRDSVKGRQAIAVLRVPKTFEIRGTHILDPAMYYTPVGAAAKSEKALQLVSIVAGRAQAEAVLRVWDSVKAESLIRRAGMGVLLSGVAEDLALETMPADVTVNRVKDPEEFSTRTGIRVLPFTLIIAGGDNVLAAGPGLPDVSFIRDAAERFIREGPSAATKFRPVTLEINSGLTGIETLFPSSAAAR